MKVKEISVSSSMSKEVKKMWFKFSCDLTAELTEDEDVNEALQKLWDKANNEVDSQMQDIVDTYK